MTDPIAFPSVAEFDGCAKEVTGSRGNPVAMTNTVPLETKFKWKDKPLWLADKGLRGVMGDDSFNKIQGVYYCDVSAMGGAVFMDTIPFLINNILGDMVETGTTAPYTHKSALLNPTSGNPQAQPTTLTWTHYDGTTPSTGARVVPYFCLSQLVITWEFATGMLMWSAKGQGFKSAAAAARPTPAPTAVQPKAAWIGQLAVGGTVPTNAVTNLEKFTLTIDRELELEYTGNTQQPLMVARAGLKAGFAATFLAQDYTYYNDVMNNTQPQGQALFTTGTASTTQALQLDMQQMAFEDPEEDGSKKMLRWNVAGSCVFNSTNVGTSGGLGPLTATVTNAVTTGTYV